MMNNGSHPPHFRTPHSGNNSNNMVNPQQTEGRNPSQSHFVNTLPRNMVAYNDGTLAIYTPATNGKRELYTEIPIPFTAIHGMQTRPRDECDLFNAYTNNYICQKDIGTLSEDSEIDLVRSTSFVEEVAAGGITRSLLMAIMVAASLQFLSGYNVVVLNSQEKYVFPGHTTWMWSLAVAALPLGAPLGAILGGRFSDSRGRRFSLQLSAVIYFGGGCLQTFATNLVSIILARFAIGISCGISSVLVPIYLGELAPARLRGMLGTVNQFAYVTGILCADLLSLVFDREDGWRNLFAVTLIFSALQLMLTPFVDESPKWLLQQNPKDENARQILQKLRNYTFPEDLEEEISIYTRVANDSERSSRSSGKGHGLYAEMISFENVRYLFYCIVALHIVQRLSGISAVFYYSTSLLEGIIDNPLLGTILIGIVNVVFSYVALLLMDSCRRKSLLLWSLGGMFAACCALILAQLGFFGSNMTLLAVIVYVSFYEIGAGPIPWLIITEMFETKYTALIVSICSQVSWIVTFVVSLVFPTVSDILGKYTFIPFGCVLLFSIFFTWKILPETLRKSPAQVAIDAQKTGKHIFGIRTDQADKLGAGKGEATTAYKIWGDSTFV